MFQCEVSTTEVQVQVRHKISFLSQLLEQVEMKQEFSCHTNPEISKDLTCIIQDFYIGVSSWQSYSPEILGKILLLNIEFTFPNTYKETTDGLQHNYLQTALFALLSPSKRGFDLRDEPWNAFGTI